MSDADIKNHIHPRAFATLVKARDHCTKLVSQIEEHCGVFLSEHEFNSDDLCCVVVGSVGRMEALAASDIDLIPVLATNDALQKFRGLDKSLRGTLESELSIKVSKGSDLTKAVSLEELTDAESIGGEKDSSSILTKRILILSEGKQAGGTLPIEKVRRDVMQAYAGTERSSGRHVLSLCNDIARYYRTLCIEYKAKADDPAKDWCTRNMKLRHSRKFWYFSCLMAAVAIADSNPQGEEQYICGLLDAFGKPPVQRLFDAVKSDYHGLVGRATESFAWFLDFMSCSDRRSKLETVEHENRYDMDLANPFHSIKLNSDRLHQELLTLLESLPMHQRHRAHSWFLL